MAGEAGRAPGILCSPALCRDARRGRQRPLVAVSVGVPGARGQVARQEERGGCQAASSGLASTPAGLAVFQVQVMREGVGRVSAGMQVLAPAQEGNVLPQGGGTLQGCGVARTWSITTGAASCPHSGSALGRPPCGSFSWWIIQAEKDPAAQA